MKDIVEIVRCKDCKYADKSRRGKREEKIFPSNLLVCRNTEWCKYDTGAFAPDYWCKYGERKEIKK